MRFSIFVVLFMVLAPLQAEAGAVLERIKQRGELNCGVNLALAGFSIADSRGVWRGLDVEYCKALAVAVLEDSSKVRYVPLGAQQRFTALQSGEVDVLSRNTSWTLSRDGGQGISFVGTLLYDGQGFIVREDLGVENVAELEGASICVQSGTTTELNMADYFRARNIQVKSVVFEGFEESVAAFFSGRCDAYTTDISALAVIRFNNAINPEDYVILAESISKEPLAPAVQQGDAEWFNIARWVLFALIEAEERGITKENVAELQKNSTDPAVRRILGVIPGVGSPLGLSDDWVARVIAAVGNYGEIYERTLGNASSLKLDRSFNKGVNQLWTEGGLMYAPPIR